VTSQAKVNFKKPVNQWISPQRPTTNRKLSNGWNVLIDIPSHTQKQLLLARRSPTARRRFAVDVMRWLVCDLLSVSFDIVAIRYGTFAQCPLLSYVKLDSISNGTKCLSDFKLSPVAQRILAFRTITSKTRYRSECGLRRSERATEGANSPTTEQKCSSQ
jgi:hypothetical protein